MRCSDDRGAWLHPTRRFLPLKYKGKHKRVVCLVIESVAMTVPRLVFFVGEQEGNKLQLRNGR